MTLVGPAVLLGVTAKRGLQERGSNTELSLHPIPLCLGALCTLWDAEHSSSTLTSAVQHYLVLPRGHTELLDLPNPWLTSATTLGVTALERRRKFFKLVTHFQGPGCEETALGCSV